MDPSIIRMYNNDNFPCFVKNGEEIENPDSAPNEQEKYARIARNGLRHLTYGTPLLESKLLTWGNFEALCIKRDPKLFRALRKEMQHIFLNVFTCLKQKQLDELAEKRVEIFINNLLCAYPFIDPEKNEKIILPQKINNAWQTVKYHVKKIDISPQSGLLSKLIEDEDRLYAYALVPTSCVNAQPYLLLEGTTYPSGQGADLNWLYNFKPNTSVGEAHDMTLLERWIERHRNIKVAGHSKGGTMAMIIASKYPYWISQADCLNPTGLCRATINRLNHSWNDVSNTIKPKINIYTQAGDPVFLIENSFLQNIYFYRIGKTTDHYGKLEAHAHYFSGRKTASIAEIVDFEREIFSKKREFISDLKEALNWAMFPLMYIKLCYKLCQRKLTRFCGNHSTVIQVAIFLLSMSVCAALIASGAGAPLAAPMAAHVGASITLPSLAGLAIAASALTSVVAPKIAKFAVNLSSAVVFSAASVITFCTTLTAGMFFSSLKLGLQSLFCKPRAMPIQPIINTQEIKKKPLTNCSSSIEMLRKIKSASNISLLENDTAQPTRKPKLTRNWRSEGDLAKLPVRESSSKQEYSAVSSEASKKFPFRH